ncbi:hypothetical protein IMSAGC011_03363 [Lachnospiraceae bacterium]|nr:hypothetical protein IMSAGC011_03363 [Lachnospiraceae bacterium]
MVTDKVKELDQENILFIKEMAFNLEAIMDKAMMACSLCNTLFTAFYCQETYSIRDFEWAFILLGDLTGDMRDELKELTGSAFDSIREGKKASTK